MKGKRISSTYRKRITAPFFSRALLEGALTGRLNSSTVRLTANIRAGFCGGHNKTGAFASAVTGTGIVGCFTVVMAFTHIHTKALGQFCFSNLIPPVIPHLAAGISTGFRWHRNKTLSFTGSHSFTGIIRCFAVVMTFTTVDPIAMTKLCGIHGSRGGRAGGISAHASSETRCSHCDSGPGKFGFDVCYHCYYSFGCVVASSLFRQISS